MINKTSIALARSAFFLCALGPLIGGVAFAAETPRDSDICNDPKNHPEFHQLDWWIGKWIVSSAGEKLGDVIVSRPEGGCAILEAWHSTVPKENTSNALVAYDADSKKWEYFWVSGLISSHLHLTAKPANDLVWTIVTADGKPSSTTVMFTRNSDGSLLERSTTKSAGSTAAKTNYEFTWRRAP